MDRATILIVDDDAALREGLVETVVGLGHAAIGVDNGEAALAALAVSATVVRAVLLDMRMPGQLDGIETLRRIQALASPPAGDGADSFRKR